MISLGVVGAAAAVAGMGTFGSFASTTSGSESVTSGTVVIALGSGAGSPIGVVATNVVPGDSIQRAVTLANSGNTDLGGVTLTTTAAPSSKLDTDATNGLKLKIESCSSAWVPVAPTSAPTYTCGGTVTTVLATQPVIGANAAITTSAATHGVTDNLRVTLSLPTTADDTFQGLSSTVSFSFTGTQRAGTSR
jgi:spore coat-associated protein N